MIDLRSDTLTKPTPEMLDYMMHADVGDDVYGEDPTVNKLQDKAAELFGKEAALFVPSGTMGNQISLNVLTEQGDEVILDSNAHIYYYETAAPSILSSLQLRPLESSTGMIDIDKIENAVRPDIYYFPKTKVIALENTHNRHGGTIIELDYIKEVRDIANKYGLKMHLDGARIWNASVETGVSLKDYAESFDTLSVCLSKGLGAPIGSLMLSTKGNIDKANKFRKILGGGMRQAGIIAAAGIFAIDNNLRKIKQDNKNARKFASLIASVSEIECIENRVHTNIVMFNYSKNIRTDDLGSELKKNGLFVHEFGNRTIRAVFHIDLKDRDVEDASEIIRETVKKLI